MVERRFAESRLQERVCEASLDEKNRIASFFH